VGVVNQPIEDAVGQRGMADLSVPPRYRSRDARITRIAFGISLGIASIFNRIP